MISLELKYGSETYLVKHNSSDITHRSVNQLPFLSHLPPLFSLDCRKRARILELLDCRDCQISGSWNMYPGALSGEIRSSKITIEGNGSVHAVRQDVDINVIRQLRAMCNLMRLTLGPQQRDEEESGLGVDLRAGKGLAKRRE